MPLAREPSAVAGIAEQVDVELLDDFRASRVMPTRGTVTSTSETGKDRSTTDPANRLTDKSIGETRSLSGESIDIRCLNQRVAITSKGTRGLVIGKEEDNVRLLRRRKERR